MTTQDYRTHSAAITALMDAQRREQRRLMAAILIWTIGAVAIIGAAACSMPRVERAYQESRV